jgi:hypothetical protein
VPDKKISLQTRRFFIMAAALLGLLVLILFGGRIFEALTRLLKGLGLAGAYLLAALVAVACLYFPLRLFFNYRLQKKALELRYLQYLAERHGVVVTDTPQGKRGRKIEPLQVPEEVHLLESFEESPEDPSSSSS